MCFRKSSDLGKIWEQIELYFIILQDIEIILRDTKMLAYIHYLKRNTGTIKRNLREWVVVS